MTQRWLILLVTVSGIVGLICGCDPASEGSSASEKLAFQAEVESNREPDTAIGELEFVDSEQGTVRLADYAGKKNVLLVFTRGFSGSLCPFCTTQTSRLIANYESFSERDTEVLLVYPGQTDQLDDFLKASMKEQASQAFPFPVLLDPELAAVKRLKIEARLAHPSTFIIDKQGNVAFSYVGANPTDRPSIKALLAQLDQLQS